MIETMPQAAPQRTIPEFRELIASIRPKPEETKWLDIPWQTDLWEGRRLAMAEGKPVFLWAMNGNPLGCT